MVAVSLAANVIGSDAAADGGGTPGCIRDHLKMKGVVALVDMIIAVAERSRLAFGQYSATLLMPALLRSQRGTAAVRQRPHREERRATPSCVSSKPASACSIGGKPGNMRQYRQRGGRP
jgi:hypothetical protein